MSESVYPLVVENSGVIRLLASVEKETGLYFFPPVPGSSPQASKFTTVSLAPQAVLYSYTTIYSSPKTGKLPFTLVYADFPEGVRVLGRLRSTSQDGPRIGEPLRIELETDSEGSVSYAFSLAK